YLIDAFMQVPAYILLPETEHRVTHGGERSIDFAVPLHIAFYLRYPEVPVAFDDMLRFLPAVTMPELPIHENGQPVLPDHDIRASRQVLCMGAVADPLCP